MGGKSGGPTTTAIQTNDVPTADVLGGSDVSSLLRNLSMCKFEFLRKGIGKDRKKVGVGGGGI